MKTKTLPLPTVFYSRCSAPVEIPSLASGKPAISFKRIHNGLRGGAAIEVPYYHTIETGQKSWLVERGSDLVLEFEAPYRLRFLRPGDDLVLDLPSGTLRVPVAELLPKPISPKGSPEDPRRRDN